MSKIEIITSFDNPKIKEVVKLRKRKGRDSQKLFIIDGYRALSLALKSSFAIKKIFYCPELLGENKLHILEDAKKQGIQIFQVKEKVFLKICYGDMREGILALAEERYIKLADLSLPENPLLVIVESLEKPGNLGAILRTCDAVAIGALIVCDGKTDIFNPNCIRASLGAFFNVPVIEGESKNTITWLKKNNFKIFLAMPGAAAEYTQADFSGPSAIVLGSEDKGLSSPWLKASNFKIAIPMRGKVNSLNVGVATAILIFEALRQRKKI